MPQIQKPVQDTDLTVFRPVILGLLQELKAFTDLYDDLPVFWPGKAEQTFQPGSSLDDKSVTNLVRGEFYNQISVEAEEQYEHDAMLTTPVEHPEHLFIFRDDYLGIYIKPAYSSMEATINFKFRARDRNTGEQWRQQLKMRIGRGRLVNLHTITYNYFIPPAMLVILQELHRMREAVAGYGQDWDTYFRQTVSPKATVEVNLAGKHDVWTMAESQMRIQGYFDFDGAPEKGTTESGAETWTITVGYHFRYHKPEVCWMKYPLMVHNQLVGQKYRPDKGPYEVEKQLRAEQWSVKALSRFEKGRQVQRIVENETGKIIPAFDEFIANFQIPKTQPLATVMLQLDPKNPRGIANLVTDLHPWQWDPEVLTYLKGEAPYITTPYRSIFQLSLYENGAMRDSSWLTVDSNLNVVMTVDPDFRSVYHLRVSIVSDLTMLDQPGKTRGQGNCGAMVKLFDFLDPTLKLRNKLPVCLPGNWLPKSGINDTSDDLNKGTIAKGNGQTYGAMKTVGQYSILTFVNKH
ncbi:MAG: hypothetical protein P4L77_10815 [Sulfuriferula sp.]|nr:hypothetical protein [Sulfuriferula sp.]